MFRRTTIFVVLALSALYFATGWFCHGWVVQWMSDEVGRPVAFASVREGLQDRLALSFSLAFAGAANGIGAWLSGRVSGQRYWQCLILLIFVSLLAAGVWGLHLAQSAAGLAGQTGDVQGLAETALPLAALRLYEIGLFAGLSVLLVAVVCELLRKVGSRASG